MCTCQIWAAEGACACLCTYSIVCVVSETWWVLHTKAVCLDSQNLSFCSGYLLLLDFDLMSKPFSLSFAQSNKYLSCNGFGFSLSLTHTCTHKYTDCKVNGFGVCPPVLICWPVKADWGLAGARHLSVECGGPDLRPPTRTELPLCWKCVCVCVTCAGCVGGGHHLLLP